MSQSGLASMAGIAKQGLSNIGAGVVVPSISTLQQIAEVLHIDLLKLIALGLPNRSDVGPAELPKIERLVSLMTPKQRKLAIDLLTAVVNQGH
ncbi:MAG TPA: helix-turn-helix transcriptional regulator [Dongiaceae bacterium]|nr:helix-turn-helix transcriptional regulator [Dongiaceae bacterium]